MWVCMYGDIFLFRECRFGDGPDVKEEVISGLAKCPSPRDQSSAGDEPGR